MRIARPLVVTVGLLGLVASASLLVVATSAGAVTFDVVNGDDSGPGSYRQAILDAGAAAEPVIVDFDPGLTVQLASDVVYTGTQPLTLIGNGSTIDGGGAQVLRDGGNLHVDGLHVRSALGEDGGAFAGTDVVISNSTFTENQAVRGGAAFASDTLVISDSTFTHNSAIEGGAAAVDGGDLDVTSSAFTTNDAQLGGALAMFSGTVAVSLSTFNDNDTVQGAGGSIVVVIGAVSLSDTTITGGDAIAGGGVAIANDIVRGSRAVSTSAGVNTGDAGATQLEPSAHLVRTTIDDSTAVAGGAVVGAEVIAISLGGGTPVELGGPAEVTATSSTFSGDVAHESGGALAVPGGSVNLVDVTTTDNAAGHGAHVQAATLTAFGTALGPIDTAACDVGATDSHGYNRAVDASCGLTAATDQEGVGDLLLGPLGENGGPTPTRVPQPGSLLLDVIPGAACQDDGAAGVATDQRGVPRPQGGSCDVGAVEVEVPTGPSADALLLQPTFTG